MSNMVLQNKINLHQSSTPFFPAGCSIFDQFDPNVVGRISTMWPYSTKKPPPAHPLSGYPPMRRSLLRTALKAKQERHDQVQNKKIITFYLWHHRCKARFTSRTAHRATTVTNVRRCGRAEGPRMAGTVYMSLRFTIST